MEITDKTIEGVVQETKSIKPKDDYIHMVGIRPPFVVFHDEKGRSVWYGHEVLVSKAYPFAHNGLVPYK